MDSKFLRDALVIAVVVVVVNVGIEAFGVVIDLGVIIGVLLLLLL